MKISIDGAPPIEAQSVCIIQEVEIAGEDDSKGELHVTATHEGVVMDVWGSKVESLDTNFGTSSETAQEIADRLCQENR